MTMITSEIYEAFKDVGVSDEKAKKAAEALTAENLATKSDVKSLAESIQEVKAEIRLIKWMIGLVIAVQVIPLLKQIS